MAIETCNECAAILAFCNADALLDEPLWTITTDEIRDVLEPENARKAREWRERGA